MSEHTVRYEVEITGHAAPFKWKVYRNLAENKRTTPNDAYGEADSLEQALTDAELAARQAAWERRHETTVITALLFEVEPDTEEHPGPPASIETGAWDDLNAYDGA